MLNLDLKQIEKQDVLTSGKLSLNTYYSRNFFNDKYTDAHGSYTEYRNTIFLSFKGTTSYANWLTNLQSRINPDSKKIQLHPGYKLVYSRFQSSIYELIDYYTEPGESIFVTGHSAGAAIATLAAYDIGQYRNVKLITWASPRVGNSSFRNSFNKRKIEALRIFNCTDPVPLVPFAIMQGYVHVGVPLNSGSLGHNMQRYYDAVEKRLQQTKTV